MAVKNERILVISDMHLPYEHRQAFEFLSAVQKQYKPDRVINIGDEIDGHSLSMHQHSPDLPSPIDELKAAKNGIYTLAQLFPKMDLLESNHGSLVFRRAVLAGLPRGVIKGYNQILGAPRTWKWHYQLILKMSNGKDVLFTHGRTSNHVNLSKTVSMSAVCGHYHEKFSINYWSSTRGLFWQMNVGCLIDNKSKAFDYNKQNLHVPIIGCGIILDGQPKLLPMILNKKGEWIKKLV
jgi:hypothetical protein